MTRWLPLALLAVLSVTIGGCGCSIDSTVNPPPGMRCIAAHDEYHDNATVVVCDTYSPTPSGGTS